MRGWMTKTKETGLTNFDKVKKKFRELENDLKQHLFKVNQQNRDTEVLDEDTQSKVEAKKNIRNSRNRKQSIKWAKDASNGLSFSRMAHRVSIKHPRKQEKG